MKIATILSALVLTAVSAFGQGQIAFQNGALAAQQLHTATYEAPATTALLPAGGQFTFFVQWGTTSGNLNTSQGSFLNSATTAGRLAGNANYGLTGSNSGDQIWLQMFGYTASAGSYATAVTLSHVANSGIYAGNSPLIQTLALTASPAPGTAIFGNSNTANQFAGWTLFTSQAVPEPGTFALLGLGAASLFLVRRKK